MKKFRNILTMAIVALFAMSACDKVQEPYLKSDEKDNTIHDFTINGVNGTIDKDAKTVTVLLTEDTDLTELVPVIKVGKYAIIEPASGVAQNFTNPVQYTVTAFNGEKAVYSVVVRNFDPEDEKEIIGFAFPEISVSAQIDKVGKTVYARVPEGTDVTNLAPEITVSEGATVSPASGEAQDFTNPVVYTVTAVNGTTCEYTATVEVQHDETVVKKVLLEDYTGVRCINCPAAAQVAHDLQEEYPGRLIVLGVHAGYLAQPVGSFPNFTTEEGDEWYSFFGFDVNPIGTVNRIPYSGNIGVNSGQWGSAVIAELDKDPVVAIKLFNTYNPDTRALNVQVNMRELVDIGDDLSLVVCLMEDNIVGKQMTTSGLVEDYVHRHVFRKSLNGAWGDIVSIDANGITNQYDVLVDEAFDASNCYIIAYVYSNSDKSILQVEEAKIME